MKKEIKAEDDIRLLVDSFYDKVNRDELLSPVFNEEAQVDWPKHLPTMYRFWGSLLLGEGDYHGRPFPPHAVLKIGRAHFERWLKLFHLTVDEHFTGLTAELAKTRANNIAGVFQYKLGLIE